MYSGIFRHATNLLALSCMPACGDNGPEPSRGVPRGDAAVGRKSSNPAQHTQLALCEAHNPPFRRPELTIPPCISGYFSLGRGASRWTTGPSDPGAPEPSTLDHIQSSAPNASVSSMGTATAWHEINKRVPWATFCGACGSTIGSTIEPSQITRSQPINIFFCQTNIAVSNHPCSRLPQQISIPLQRRSTLCASHAHR